MDMSLSGLRELVMDREAWRDAAHVVTKSWTWLSNWPKGNFMSYLFMSTMEVYIKLLQYQNQLRCSPWPWGAHILGQK